MPVDEEPNHQLETNKLFSILEDLCARKTFNAVEELLVSIKIETDFIERYVISIYPTKRKLTPLDASPIEIFSTGAFYEVAITTTPLTDGKDHNNRAHISRSVLNNNEKLSAAK